MKVSRHSTGDAGASPVSVHTRLSPRAPRALQITLRITGHAVWVVCLLAVPACGPAADQEPVDGSDGKQTSTPPDRLGFGTPASHDEITAWDIDVMPDGTGLPPGQGTVDTGAVVFSQRCASCHGADGTGGSGSPLVSNHPQTAPPFGPRYEEWRGEREDLPFTIGNYWPYATTLFDYIRRAMPGTKPGSLSGDDVYSLVAWLLARNAIIPEDLVMNAETLPDVQMPARGVFVPDDRRGGAEVR